MKKQFIAATLAVMISSSLFVTGCGSSNTETEATKTSVTFEAETEPASGKVIFEEDTETVTADSEAESAESGSTAAGTSTETSTSDSDIFTNRDMTQDADTTNAETITVADGEDITISEAGTYVITGTAENATIIVDADDEAKVQLVLDNVTITNEDCPAIYVKNADKVFVTTAEGSENTLSVTGTFTADGDTNTDGVIFAKDDLVLNGLGTCTINSTDNGIVGKDDLKATGGTWIINADSKGIEVNDSISICDGSYTITAGGDGIHCENDEDLTVGSVYISGGSFNINAGSDGIQATTTLTINGGSFNISGEEGLESTTVTINDGTIYIEASDDGINAAEKSTAVDILIEFYGGDTTIVMGQGDTDAIDSNGYIYVYDGTITITGMSAFDYAQGGAIYGGTVTVNGQQVTEMTTQMMGGMMGGGMMGGQGQMPGGGFGQSDGSTMGPGSGEMPSGEAPDFSQGQSGDSGSMGPGSGEAPDFSQGQMPGGGFGGQGQMPGGRR